MSRRIWFGVVGGRRIAIPTDIGRRLALALLWLVIWSGASSAAPFVGAPEHTSGDYQETTEDIRVKVMGGQVTVERTWSDGAWHINRHWDPLAIVRDPVDNGIKAIERNGDRYEPSANDPDLFRYGKRRTIEVTAEGFRWRDRDGNRIDYDGNGRMLAYAGRNDVEVSIGYDAEGRRNGVFDHRGEQVLWFDYDADDRLIRIRDYSGRQVEYGYGGGERIETVTDLRGKLWQYGYGGDLLTSRTDPEGHTVTLKYNSQKRLIEVSDALGVWRKYLYDYDKTRREYLFRITDGTGSETDSWYDRDGSLVRREIAGETVESIARDGNVRRVTAFSGLTTTLRHDGQDNLVAVTFADGTSKTTSWDLRWSLPTQTTNENGVVTRYEYDARGNRTRLIEAVGTAVQRTIEYSYDAFGNLLTERRLGDTVTAEATTSYTYDDWGNRRSETDPEGHVTSYEHDAMGNQILRVDARDAHWQTAYDAAGNRTAETDPLDHSETFAYDGAGNLTLHTDRNGHATEYAYDVRNQRIRTTDALGAVSTMGYDAAGRPIRTTDPAGRVTTYAFDNAGRLIERVQPADLRTELTYAAPDDGVPFHAPRQMTAPGLTETYAYDRRGRRNRVSRTPEGGSALVTLKVFDPVGNQTGETDAAGRTRTTAYDALNRVERVTNAAGGIQRLSWDNRDNLRSVENPRGILIRQYGYDRADRMISETWPGGGQRGFAHDATGNLTEIVDAKGQVIRHDYDVAGRLTDTGLFPDAAATTPERRIGFGYDAVGNRTTWSDTDPVVSAVVDYDAVNRKTAELIDFGAFEAGYQYSYSADGKKTALVYPDGLNLGFDYDAAGRLLRVQIPDIGNIGFSAYQRLLPTEILYPGGTSRGISYDGLDRIVGLQVDDAAGATLMQQGLSYDAVGNLVGKTSEHGNYQFEYDVLDRLTTADNPTLADETYGYDGAGNRTESAGQPNWTYDDADQLLSDGIRDYAYDANGNLVGVSEDGAQVQRLEYDLQDRLVAAYDGDDNPIGNYAYDPMGRRIRSGDTWYLYADEGLLAEMDATGQILRRHGWRPDGTWGTDPLWMQSDAGVFFSLNDQLGTPWQQVDSAGNRQWEARYQAFGAATVLTGQPMDNPWRLPGQYLVPELGSHYNYWRHYDPAAGRYQRFDPLGIRASVNTYGYAFNNPLTRFDAFGLFCGSGTGVNESGCAGFTYVVGGQACAEVKCCDNECGQYCCSYFKICVCVGAGGGIGVTANVAAGPCSLGGGPSGVSFGCGPCQVDVGTEIGATCCYCKEAAKTCT